MGRSAQNISTFRRERLVRVKGSSTQIASGYTSRRQAPSATRSRKYAPVPAYDTTGEEPTPATWRSFEASVGTVVVELEYRKRVSATISERSSSYETRKSARPPTAEGPVAGPCRANDPAVSNRLPSGYAGNVARRGTRRKTSPAIIRLMALPGAYTRLTKWVWYSVL